MFGFVSMGVTLSACGSDTAQEPLIEALADVDGLDVEIDDGAFGYRVEGEDGVVVVGSGVSLPSGFPDNIRSTKMRRLLEALIQRTSWECSCPSLIVPKQLCAPMRSHCGRPVGKPQSRC